MPTSWLFKTEPSDYAFEDLARDGKTRWEGVRNALALIHLRKVRKGDPVMIYHTGAVKAVIGLAKASANAEGDTVEVVPIRPLSKPVAMADIRKNPKLKTLELVRNSRLSVMPVSGPHWDEILRMSET